MAGDRVVKLSAGACSVDTLTTVMLHQGSHEWEAVAIPSEGLVLVEDTDGRIGFLGTSEHLQAMAGGILIALENVIAPSHEAAGGVPPASPDQNRTEEPETERP